MTATGSTPDGGPDLAPFLLSTDAPGGRISLHGELDRRHVDRLLRSLAVLSCSQSPRWWVDLAGDAGRTLVVSRPGPWLRRLLDLAGLSHLHGGPAPTPAPSRQL
jgi:hypothetical protein